MSDIILTPTIILNAVTASGASSWIPVSYRFNAEQPRSVYGYRTDADCPITILTKISVPTYDLNGSPLSKVEVTATVTTFVSGNGTFFNQKIDWPFTHLQVIKVNSSGAATVVGLL